MKTSRHLKLHCTLPKEAGEVYGLMQCKDALVATCEGGVYVVKDGKAKLLDPTYEAIVALIDSCGAISDGPLA